MPVAATPPSQPTVYQPYASSQRGLRSDPSHLTGGRDVAVSMSLMGVAEGDETQDVTGWDDFEFGIHNKPPCVHARALRTSSRVAAHLIPRLIKVRADG